MLWLETCSYFENAPTLLAQTHQGLDYECQLAATDKQSI